MSPLNKWPAFCWRKNLVFGKHDFWGALAVFFFGGEGGYISWSFKSTQYGRLQKFHTLFWANFSNNLHGEKWIFHTRTLCWGLFGGCSCICQCTFLFVCARWTYAQQKSSGVTENLDLPGQENLHQLYSSICQTETYCTWNYFIYCILLSKKMECLGMSIIGIIHKLKSQRVQTFWKDANFVRFLLKQFVGPIFITGMFSAPLQSPLWMVHHYKARSSPSDLKCVRPRWFLSQQRQLAEQNDLVLWNMWHPERGVVFMILGGGWTTHLKDMIVKLDPQFSGRKFQKTFELPPPRIIFLQYPSYILVWPFGLYRKTISYIDFPCVSLAWIFLAPPETYWLLGLA